MMNCRFCPCLHTRVLNFSSSPAPGGGQLAGRRTEVEAPARHLGAADHRRLGAAPTPRALAPRRGCRCGQWRIQKKYLGGAGLYIELSQPNSIMSHTKQI